MPTVPAAVATYLLTGKTPSVRDCITITRADSTVHRWASGTANVVDGGVTWYGNQVAFKRGTITVESNSRGDDLEITLANRPGYVAIDLVKAGMSLTFRRARVQLWEAFYDSEGGTYLGLVGPLFDGTVNEPEVPEATTLKLTARNAVAAGAETYPKHMIATACPYTYGDTDCGATPATSSQHVHAGSTTTKVVANAANTTTMLPGGLVTFTSGALNGVTAMIASVSGANLTLDQALASIPAVNDTFTVTAPCDKSVARCRALGNILRCGACPWAPNQDNGLNSAVPVTSVVSNQPQGVPHPEYRSPLRFSEGIPVPEVIGEAWVTPIVAYMVRSYPKQQGQYATSTLFDSGYMENPDAAGGHWSQCPAANCILVVGKNPLTIVGVRRGNETNTAEPMEALRRLGMHSRLQTEDQSSAADVLNDCIGMRPWGWQVVNGSTSPWGQSSVGRDLYVDLTGASPPTWGELTGTDADGMGYAGLCQIRYQRIALSNAGKLPDIQILVQSSHGKDVRPDTALRYLMHDVIGIADADIITDVGIDGNAASSYKNYIDEQPTMRVNIVLEAHQDPWEAVDALLQASNAERVQVGGKWRIQVLDDTPKGTYTPSSTSIAIGQDDFAEGSRIQVKVTPEDQIFNCMKVRYKDQANSYKESVRPWRDDADVRLHRLHIGPEISNFWISTAAHATLLANIEVRKSQNRIRKFLLTLNKRLISLEPGHLITIADAHEIDAVLARIYRVQYESDTIKVEAWESRQKGVTPIDITVQASAGTTPLPGESFEQMILWAYDQVGVLETDAEDADNLYPNGFSNHFPPGSDPSDLQWQDLYNAGAGAYAGSWVRRIVTASVPRWGARTPDYFCGDTGQWQGGRALVVACSPGDVFVFSARAKLAVKSNGSTTAGLVCRFLDSSGNVLSPASSSATTGNTTWTLLTCNPTAPAGAVKCLAYYEVNCTASVTAGETAYFDAFNLTQNGGANLYPNPDCETLAPTPLYADLTDASVPAQYRHLNAAAAFQGFAGRRITATATTTPSSTQLDASRSCKPGEQYFIEGTARAAQAPPANIGAYYGAWIDVTFWDAYGNYLPEASGRVEGWSGNGITGATWQRITCQTGPAPTGTVEMRMRLIVVHQTTSGTATVSFDFDAIHCIRSVASEHIPDGTVEPQHFAPDTDGASGIVWGTNWADVGGGTVLTKSVTGLVFLHLKCERSSGTEAVPVTLPAGYRPAKQFYEVYVSEMDPGCNVAYVSADGTVYFYNSLPSSGKVYHLTTTFRAA